MSATILATVEGPAGASDWTIRHFSQSNPKGGDQGSVPALLRRVAETIEDLGPVAIQDVVFHSELDDEGESWPTVTVYFSPPGK